MSTPTVSIIVPNYNHSKFLEQRLTSIFDQTYQDFEVIILDDCSMDNSREIIERYRSNPKVSKIVYNEVNSGSPFKQWNSGFQLAKGEYIWIAESDDYCENTFLEILLDAAQQHNSVLAYSLSVMVNEDGMSLFPRREFEDKFLDGLSFIRKYLIYSNVIRNASCTLFRREVLNKVRKDYMSFRGAGDYLFWVEIAAQGKVAIVNKPLNYCRCHNSNVTTKSFSSGTAAIEDKQVYKYIVDNIGICWWRKQLSFASHRRMFENVTYDSEEIKQMAFSTWNIDKRNARIDHAIMQMVTYLKDRNIYL